MSVHPRYLWVAQSPINRVSGLVIFIRPLLGCSPIYPWDGLCWWEDQEHLGPTSGSSKQTVHRHATAKGSKVSQSTVFELGEGFGVGEGVGACVLEGLGCAVGLGDGVALLVVPLAGEDVLLDG